MKRRNFIKLTASASALAMLPTEVMAMLKNFDVTNCPDNSNKKLVLIQLQGANDGLNTIIPINQYDLYSNLRPNIKLNLTGNNAAIALDNNLSIENQVALHPSLIGFKNLYDSGLMRIIQGVGYPNQDKSHFKSTDLWLTGGDGTPANNNIGNGWMGRFLEKYYAEFLSANFPLGLQFGSSDNSLGFHGAEHSGLSMNLNNQDLNGYFSIINGLGGEAPTNIPQSEYGDLLQYILQNDANTNIYANTITTAFNNGSNTISYPNTSLSNQLKTVAKLISGGLDTKIYLVRIGGFDTHDSQVVENAAHTGTHANLLLQVSEAVQAFITDLNTQNLGQDVIGVTFSEFGRKISENASFGTDHGEVAPMFLFGSSLNPGVSGTNINLLEATAANNYQVETVQYDYRSVFSTILQDWLGSSNQTLNYTFYDQTNNLGFANNKIPFTLLSNQIVTENCYSNTLLSTEVFNVKNEVNIYPNPTSDILNIVSFENIDSIKVYSLDGRLIINKSNQKTSNKMTILLNGFNSGTYIIQIKTISSLINKKFIVKK
jgi:uncharacterized protein (DUF1501 family)